MTTQDPDDYPVHFLVDIRLDFLDIGSNILVIWFFTRPRNRVFVFCPSIDILFNLKIHYFTPLSLHFPIFTGRREYLRPTQ